MSYNPSPDEANMIAALSISTMPQDLRRELITDYALKHGAPALANLFAEFAAVTVSVLDNTRECVELFFIIEAKMHPHDAEKLNLPTIMGAMKGLEVAVEPTPAMCHGCAYRKGSYANQSLCTATDASDCRDDGDQFKCHIDLDDQGNPTKGCAGWAAARKAGKI